MNNEKESFYSIVVLGGTSDIAVEYLQARLKHGLHTRYSFHLVGRNEDRLNAVKSHLSVLGAKVNITCADVNDLNQIKNDLERNLLLTKLLFALEN